MPLIVCYVAAVFLPPLGLCLGIVLILFRRRGDGIAVIGISLVVAVLFLVKASRDDDKASLSPAAERQAKTLSHCVLTIPHRQSFEERMRVCERRLRWQGAGP